MDDDLPTDPIAAFLFDPTFGELWRSIQGLSKGSFHIDHHTGWHKFCLQNANLGNDDEEVRVMDWIVVLDFSFE